MKQITVRRVLDRCVEEAKVRARQRGVAMNTILVEALEKGLGIEAGLVRRNNLDRFAGDSDFGPEWDAFLETDLKQVDESLWK